VDAPPKPEPGSVPVKKISVKNNSKEDIQSVTVTDKRHVAGKPVRASLGRGSGSVDLDMSGSKFGWQSSSLVLTVHGSSDTSSVSLIDLSKKKAMVLTSSLSKPLKVDVVYVPASGHLTLTLKH
jgi:hypothetical protein